NRAARGNVSRSGTFRPVPGASLALSPPIATRPTQRKDHIMRMLPVLAAVASLSVLAACGNREPERAEGGAATGAATGAAVGLVGGPVGVAGGALIGGAVGGAAGAATKPSDVNLGSPPWHDNSRTGQEAAAHMAH